MDDGMLGRVIARATGAGALLLLSGVHAAWACGSSWPAPTRVELARAVIGRDALPGPLPTVVVVALLAGGALLVGGRPVGPRSLVERVGSAGVAGVLALRGVAGVSGAMPHERRSATFRRWNRRLYSPLCFALALLASAGAREA